MSAADKLTIEYENGIAKIESVKTKVCSKCLTVKPVELFYNAKANKDGLTNQCKDCFRVYQKAYRKTPKGRAYHNKTKLKYQKKYPEKVYARGLKWRATESGKNKISSTYKRYSDELTDAHVRAQIKRQTKLSSSGISQDLIELKRQIILSKRAIKEVENDSKN